METELDYESKLKEKFDKYDNEFCKFDRITNKKSVKSDLHAFLILETIDPSTASIIDGADHDVIFISTNLEDVYLNATDEQICELVRCGIFIQSGSLVKWV